jgi:hypothetical protein
MKTRWLAKSATEVTIDEFHCQLGAMGSFLPHQYVAHLRDGGDQWCHLNEAIAHVPDDNRPPQHTPLKSAQ